MLERLNELVAARESIVYESTLSTRSFAPFLRRCREEAGYEISLLFVWLATPEMALERVENRVRSGGHRVPADDVRRRYYPRPAQPARPLFTFDGLLDGLR